jgi:uncharacterized RDD family membrane protein YckC
MMFCSRCGAALAPGAVFCSRCGTPVEISAAATSVSVPLPSVVGSSLALSVAQYAGFWRRVWASLIDSIVLSIIVTPLGLLLGLPVFGLHMVDFENMDPEALRNAIARVVFANLLHLIAGWIYFSLMQSSTRQASLGQMALGMKVTDLNGGRISLSRASSRYFAALISVITLGIGFLMVAFTEKKQALHDMICGTLVVRT